MNDVNEAIDDPCQCDGEAHGCQWCRMGHDCPDECGGGLACPYVRADLAAARRHAAPRRAPDYCSALELAALLGKAAEWSDEQVLARAAELRERAATWRLHRAQGHPAGAVVVEPCGAAYVPVAKVGAWCDVPAEPAPVEPFIDDSLPF